MLLIIVVFGKLFLQCRKLNIRATQLTNEFAQIRWAGIYVKTRHIKRAAFWAAL